MNYVKTLVEKGTEKENNVYHVRINRIKHNKMCVSSETNSEIKKYSNGFYKYLRGGLLCLLQHFVGYICKVLLNWLFFCVEVKERVILALS